ncbi:hypothetical protein [Sulfuricystis multivorans]|uniref:hypothetical protein n=1 Tax=Sulfuricystis multivorans TaxID=2211108 RepID=UPI000F8334BD|nr:hypothetical protein [Sulfuricystis multivorans]
MSRHAFLIVVPVADRPRQMQACLASLAEQLRRFPYAGRIRVLLADDSLDATSIEANRALSREFSALGLETIHFTPDEQRRRVAALASPLPRVLGATPLPPYGHKGQGLMRNIAYLEAAALLRAETAEDTTLIWSIDSDQEFRVDVPENDGVVLDYFNTLDAIFTRTDAEVLTGKVVGDPPVSAAVMTRNFLDDVLAFLTDCAQRDPFAPCSHHGATVSHGDAAYHDMAELFGFKPAAHYPYSCPLAGPHSEAEGFAHFSARANSFFYGEHPTRITRFQPGDPLESLAPARTVYAGNVVFRPSALRYFIPFAHLRLRMSGPTLGRILKAELGARFVSANLPLLHRRTVERGGQAEFRPGIETQATAVDISGEFERQFYGDVMLFTVERLTAQTPLCRIASAEFERLLDTLREEMLARYNERQAAVLERLARLEAWLADPAQWWNRQPGLAEGLRHFAANVRRNFAAASSGHAQINDAQRWQDWRARLIDGLVHYAEDRAAWARLL